MPRIRAALIWVVWLGVALLAPPVSADWTAGIAGTATGSDTAQAVAFDGAGDVISAGEMYSPTWSFALLKHSGTTGAELWRTVLGSGWAFGVAVDGTGDVIGAGYTNVSGVGSVFTVLKASGGTGAEIWRTTVFPGQGTAISVAVDAAGDVVAAGYADNRFSVVKLAGVNGAELWRKVVIGTSFEYGVAFALVLDGAGDVFAGGNVENVATQADFTVVKLAGTSGAELWRMTANGTMNDTDVVRALALTPSGDVVAVGDISNAASGRDFLVAKIRSSDGMELWRQEFDGSGFSDFDGGSVVTVDSAGDVVAGGNLINGFSNPMTVLKLAGASGAELWRSELLGTGAAAVPTALAVVPGGDVVAAGYIDNAAPQYSSFAVVRFSGASGAEVWRRQLDGTDRYYALHVEGATALAVHSSGDVVAAGAIANAGAEKDYTVARIHGSDGAEVWRTVTAGDGNGSSDYGVAAALDGAGNIVAVGLTENAGSGNDFTVAKIASATGTELWRQTLDGGAVGAVDYGRAVAVDAAGDVIAAGTTDNAGTNFDVTVVKLSGTTGAEIWRRVIDGGAGAEDRANALALDAAGDVLVAGALDAGSGFDFAVVKLAGASGAEVWRRTLAGAPGPGPDEANAVAVTTTGDVVAAGVLYNTILSDLAVVRLRGSDGAELWRRSIDGTDSSIDAARAVAVDPAGDVVAAGATRNTGTSDDLTVVKLAGAAGTELWRRVVSGTAASSTSDNARMIAFDAAGNPVVAGTLTDAGTNADFTVMKLATGTGAEIWRRVIDSAASHDDAYAVAADPFGDVVAAGSIGNSFSVVKLAGASGTSIWSRGYGYIGAQSVLVDAAGDVFATGSLFDGPAADSYDDFVVVKISLCGNAIVEAAEQCDAGFAAFTCCTTSCSFAGAGSECRPAGSVCDAAETCSGASADCPPDLPAPAGTLCRAAVSLCDVPETCTGSSMTCPSDVHASAATPCRPAADVCDEAETCNGISVVCPADAPKSFGTPCRPAAGQCDVAEFCSGASTACPADAFLPPFTICRVAGGDCGLGGMCSGVASNCPGDDFLPPGTPCTDDGVPCTADVCDGSGSCAHPIADAGMVCRAATGPCDVAEVCDGVSTACPVDVRSAGTCRAAAGACDVAESCDGTSDACPLDAFQPAGAVCLAASGVCAAVQCTGTSGECPIHAACDDGLPCTTDTCDPGLSCVHTPLPDGATCDDGDQCSVADQCTAGICAGGPGGTIAGTVFLNDTAPGSVLAGAFVQACNAANVCRVTSTDPAGHYTTCGLLPGAYTVTAFPPGSSSALPASAGPVAITGTETVSGIDVIVTGPLPLPPGMDITKLYLNPQGVPAVHWNSFLALTRTGCPGGTASYVLAQDGVTVRSGAMVQGPSGTYTATLDPLTPLTGYARVSVTIDCPGSGPTTATFDVYIDPSGTVRTVDGAPVEGASVTLFRADTPDGLFAYLPDGSGMMSLANRANPDRTDADGRFGWDVVAGFYRVRAEKFGCVSPADPLREFVESPILAIPPPVTDLDLRLVCDCVPVTKGRIRLQKLGTPTGDDKLSFRGEVMLPAPVSPPLDPAANGVRLLVRSAAGTVLDVTLPPGTGWITKISRAGTRWTYTDKTAAPPAGIYKVVVRDATALPGLVRFAAKGKAGSYPVAPGELPLSGLVTLSPPSAQCGDLVFASTDCAAKKEGATLSCK